MSLLDGVISFFDGGLPIRKRWVLYGRVSLNSFFETERDFQ